MERKNALASARESGTGGHQSSRSKGKDIKVLKSEFLNRETEPSTGSTGSVIQQLETSIEKMETSGVGTGEFSLPDISLIEPNSRKQQVSFFVKKNRIKNLQKFKCSLCTGDVFYKQLQRNHRLLVNHQLREAQEPNWLGR